jgi:hypothetical protein
VGSSRHGYEVVAPLDADALIDSAAWRKYRGHCGVRRFWGAEDETGRLVHKLGGHARWIFDHDEIARRRRGRLCFGSHAFRPGEYVSIRNEGRRLAYFPGGFGRSRRLILLRRNPGKTSRLVPRLSCKS